jgi:hypothetical protein
MPMRRASLSQSFERSKSYGQGKLNRIKALQREQKSFEVQVGSDLGHTGVNQQRMMEFFIENLVLKFTPIP